MGEALQQIVDQVRAASAARTPLCIRGGGTKQFYGNPVDGSTVETQALQQIVAYEPTELVVTAQAGVRLAALEALLDERDQMLGFEPPHFGSGASVGGCVAAGLSGPRRIAVAPAGGAVRDFVLGARMIDGRGRSLAFGGTVMKNVVGYDVSRLLAGSLGTLGILTEVSLKVVPRPPAETTLRFAACERDALSWMNEWSGLPLPVSAAAWHEGQLAVRLSGARAAVAAAVQTMGGERDDDSPAFWNALREHRLPWFAGPLPSWRISLPSTAPPLDLDGAQLIDWGGAQRWLRSAAPAMAIRKRAAELGGHATLFRGDARTAGAFSPLTPALLTIHRRLKAEFDPEGILNRGRMYPEL
jgi:glycolate oxidase FAD binding subunit